MEEEQLKVFDENRTPIGIAARSEIHKKGLWHETFHCWIISEQDGESYLYLQIRSPLKKDYPNLLDITAAGHLLAHEEAKDGVREMEEEIGICVEMDELIYLGVFHYEMNNGDILDKEFAHTYLYKRTMGFKDFRLQEEEVAGIVATKLADFYDLWQGGKEIIEVNGFEVNARGERITIHRKVGRESFAPHPISYYKRLIQGFKENV